jgi:hypothetical protein
MYLIVKSGLSFVSRQSSQAIVVHVADLKISLGVALNSTLTI